MESQDLDKLFRDAFEQAEETPNESVWQGIEQELHKEKKVVPFYIKYRAQLSIAASLVLFFGIGLTFYKQPIHTGNEKVEEVLNAMEKQSETSSDTNISTENNEVVVIDKVEPENLKKNKISTPTIPVQNEIKKTSSYQADDKYVNKIVEHRNEVITSDMLTAVEADIDIKKTNYQEIKTLAILKYDIQPSQTFTATKEENKSSIVTRVLNGITKNIISKSIDIPENREIEFQNDEEGSLSLNIFNSLAKK